MLVRELFSAPPSTTQSTTPTCCIAPQSPQHPHSSTRRPPPHPKSTLRSSQPRRSLTSTSPQRSQSAVTRSSQRNSTIQNNKKTIADIVNKVNDPNVICLLVSTHYGNSVLIFNKTCLTHHHNIHLTSIYSGILIFNNYLGIS